MERDFFIGLCSSFFLYSNKRRTAGQVLTLSTEKQWRKIG